MTSEPTGALVVFEGEHTLRGRTPFTLSRGLSGRYEVHAYAPGYEEWHSTLYLDPTTSRTLTIEFSRRSRWKAVLRSAIFPGWGQSYSDQGTKALVFAGCEVAALAWTGVEHVQYQEKVDKLRTAERNYLGAREIDTIERLYAEMERRRSAAADKYDDQQAALYAVGTVWAVNVLDSLFFYPSTSHGLYSQLGSHGELYAGLRWEF